MSFDYSDLNQLQTDMDISQALTEANSRANRAFFSVPDDAPKELYEALSSVPKDSQVLNLPLISDALNIIFKTATLTDQNYRPALTDKPTLGELVKSMQQRPDT